MNNKESVLMQIVDTVVDCCATQIDELGTMSITKNDVLGKSRADNAVMTRCILVLELCAAGYSTQTVAMLIHKTPQAIRYLKKMAYNYMETSRAFRIAAAEATIRCKDIGK